MQERSSRIYEDDDDTTSSADRALPAGQAMPAGQALLVIGVLSGLIWGALWAAFLGCWGLAVVVGELL